MTGYAKFLKFRTQACRAIGKEIVGLIEKGTDIKFLLHPETGVVNGLDIDPVTAVALSTCSAKRKSIAYQHIHYILRRRVPSDIAAIDT
jgi:hypothetical protein